MNLRKFFKDFCENTTIHGFVYIGGSRSRLIEKIFWSISLLISLTLTVLLIQKLFSSITRNPIVVYTDDNAIHATEIYFPAMTICPTLKLGLNGFNGFNFLQVSKDIESGKLNLSDLSSLHQIYLQIVSLIAGDYSSFNSSIPPILTNDLIDRLRDFPFHWRKPHPQIPGTLQIPYNPEHEADWRWKYEVNFTEILSSTGFCYTFNFPGADGIFNLKELSDDFHFSKIVSMTRHLHYYSEKELERPMKTHNYKTGLSATLYQGPLDPNEEWFNNFYDSHPSEILDGFHLFFHDPYELPSASSQQLHTLTQYKVEYLVNPEIASIDESLYDYSIDDRNCYLEDERTLLYFKKYLKSNCEHECLANLTVAKCSCAKFFQVRNKSTRICGMSDANCFKEVENEFPQTGSECRCFEPCESLKYRVDLKILYKVSFGYNGVDFMPATFSVKFGSKNYFEQKRKQQFSNFEILSFIGGLLGLFTGFSFISGTELIYMIAKSFFKPKSSSRVYPLSERVQRKSNWIVCYLKSFLENCSIHSFKWIAKERRITQKIFWTVIFVFFIFGFEFVSTRMFGKFKSDSIIQTQDGTPRSVNSIPFPAVTVVDITKQETMLLLEFALAVALGPVFTTPTKEEFDEIFKDYPFKIINSTVDANLCYQDAQKTSFITTVDYLNYTFENPSVFVEHLKKWLPQRSWFEASEIIWNRHSRPFFTETLTTQGIGFTFNIAKAEDLITKNISEDFQYTSPENHSLLTTSTNGDRHLQMSFERRNPFFVFEYGIKNPFGFPKFQNCRDEGVIVHSNYELPTNFEYDEYTRMTPGYTIDLLITPQVVETDENLRSFSPKIRQCYFEGEFKLEFFEHYTTGNCLAECYSKIIFDLCHCVQFYYPRNSTMEVCSAPTRDCAVRLKLKILDLEYCNQCFPPCNSITYEIEMRQAPFARPFSEALKNTTSITVRFKDEEFYAIRRYQQFTVQDFLSNIGGLMGVFAGISCLSLVEFIYFFTLRLFSDLMKLRRVQVSS